jgi:hypothetical protein
VDRLRVIDLGQRRLVGSYEGGLHYDPSNDRWTPTGTEGQPLKRAWLAGAWTGEHLLIWGGDRHGEVRDDGAAYDPIKRSWTPLASKNAPSPRCKFASVWTGKELLVWGGSKSITIYGDGARWSAS